MLIGRRQRPVWERVVLFLLVVTSLAMAAAIYSKRDQVYKERLLITELQTMRNFLMAYYLRYEKFPLHLVGLHMNAKDPFGTPYDYNAKRGWVASRTPGYSDW